MTLEVSSRAKRGFTVIKFYDTKQNSIFTRKKMGIKIEKSILDRLTFVRYKPFPSVLKCAFN